MADIVITYSILESWLNNQSLQPPVETIRDAVELLKEQKSWTNEIEEYQYSIVGSEMHELTDYEKGKWDGLQIAWNIISEGR